MSTEAIVVLAMFLVRFALPVALLFALGAHFGAPSAQPVR
jgi:hypothetical protein